MNTQPLFTLPRFGALLVLGLASACQGGSPSAEEFPLHAERMADSVQFSWEGDKVHRVTVIECDDAPRLELCGCTGHVVWQLGAAESESFQQVALEAPFLASPLQYEVTPESDRRGDAARPLVAGKTYLASASRVGPWDGSRNCQQQTAFGCASFVW
jgi:hypothetical protein